MPQLRQSIITGDWVVFAPERAKRPSDYVWKAHQKQEKGDGCPFCIESKTSSYPERVRTLDKETTYTVPNKFPAFIEDPRMCDPKRYKIEDEFYSMRSSLGGHDVVVVRDHDQDLPRFTEAIWDDILETFTDQYKHFKDMCNVEYVMPIYNHGPEAAASIDHPHAQIFSSIIIPNIVAREISYTKQRHDDRKECSFCELIEHEKEQNLRIIFENDDFVAFTFYAARFPFEIWILPKKHQSHFTDMKGNDRGNLVKICRQIFNRLDVVLNDPPLNFFIHSAPVKERPMVSYHWHMEVAPRLTNYGGYEMGSGVIIDIINPESAADYLRMGQKVKNSAKQT